MAAAFRSVTVHESAGTVSPKSFSVPAGVQDDDLLLMLVFCSTSSTIDTHADWNLLMGATAIPRGASAAVNRYYLYYRWASSEPASYSIVGNTTIIGGYMAAYSGIDTSSTPTVQGNVGLGQDAVASVSATMASTADQGVNEILIYMGSGQGSASSMTFTEDAGTTERLGRVVTNGPASKLCVTLADEQYTSSGNYPARTHTNDYAGTVNQGICFNRIYGLRPVVLGNDHWGWAEPASTGGWGGVMDG